MFFFIFEKSVDQPCEMWPPFLPEAPKPIYSFSKTQTLNPASASSIAEDKPVNPPPIIAISHSIS